MSLQIWLPLDGNLDNQGLSNVIVTNNGATVDNNGKIGKCYSFDGTDDYIDITGLNLGNNWSYGCWFKEASSTRTWSGIIILNTNGGDADMQLGFYSNPSTSRIQSTANGQYNSGISHTFDGQWHHLFATFDGSNLKTYRDGILINTKAITATLLPRTKLTLGARCRGSSYDCRWLGSMNDFRLYDHCLSPKEVEEISKGLILHYKLDQNINTLNNCYSYPTFNTSSSNGGWSHWGSTGHIGSYGQNTDTKYIFRKENTYSHWVANGDGATYNYLCYQSPAFEGGFRSLQAIIKEENSNPITETIVYPAWNARNGGAPNNLWTSITYLGDGFYLCKCEGISQDGSNDLVGIYVRAGYKIYISEAYLENDKQICSDIFYQDSILTIYDVSGYNNNGELYAYDTNGSIELTNDSPRYNLATFINSNDNTTNTASGTRYIYGHCGLTNPTKMSVAFWCKPIAGYGNSTGQGQFCTTTYEIGTNAGSDYQGSAMNHRDSAVDINDAASTTQCRPSFTPTANEWHHYVITYDGQNGRVYKDGVQSSTASFSEPKTLDSFIGVIIGFSKAGGVWRSNQTYYSDFRVYCTTLSADQVKELYNTSASIDSFGNIHTREVVEI